MTYSVRTTRKFDKSLKELDKYTQRMIIAWIERNLEGATNPRTHGKALVGNLRGLWRYRIGDYRVICQINDGEMIILALIAGHRKSIYKELY